MQLADHRPRRPDLRPTTRRHLGLPRSRRRHDDRRGAPARAGVARSRLVTAQPQPAGSSRPVLSAEFLVIGGGGSRPAAARALAPPGGGGGVLDHAPPPPTPRRSPPRRRIFTLRRDQPRLL